MRKIWNAKLLIFLMAIVMACSLLPVFAIKTFAEPVDTQEEALEEILLEETESDVVLGDEAAEAELIEEEKILLEPEEEASLELAELVEDENPVEPVHHASLENRLDFPQKPAVLGLTENEVITEPLDFVANPSSASGEGEVRLAV